VILISPRRRCCASIGCSVRLRSAHIAFGVIELILDAVLHLRLRDNEPCAHCRSAFARIISFAVRDEAVADDGFFVLRGHDETVHIHALDADADSLLSVDFSASPICCIDLGTPR